MKYLLVLAVVWVAFLIWRQRRRDEARAAAPPAPTPPPSIPAPQAMLRCAQCGLHLPGSDAIKGRDGRDYCSAAHRQAGEA